MATHAENLDSIFRPAGSIRAGRKACRQGTDKNTSQSPADTSHLILVWRGEYIKEAEIRLCVFFGKGIWFAPVKCWFAIVPSQTAADFVNFCIFLAVLGVVYHY